MKKYLIPVIFIVSFLYALPAYNKFWFPFDEGITLVCADMIQHGAVPYRDFLTIYGPTQLLLLAFLFKIFGTYLQLAHLYIIFLHAVVATVIFYLAYKLCRNKRISVFIWIVGVSCLAPRMGASASSMWPFMVFGALSMLFFIWFIEKRCFRDIILAALFASIGFLGRFEMGLYLMACEIFIIIVYGTFRYLLPYVITMSILPATFIIYLANEGALKNLWECLKLPYTTTIRFGQNNFPLPCVDLKQIFYGSLFFITVNQHYIPVITYAVTAACILYLNIKKRMDPVKTATLLFITLAGVIIFPYAYFGANVTHTMPVIFPALILAAYIFQEAMNKREDSRAFKYFIRISAILIAFLLVLLFIKNTDKYIKNVLVKPFTKKIIYLGTKRGGSYVPEEDVRPFSDVVDFIEKNTAPDEKIFIGFESHSDLFQGGEPMVYFLSGRLPATKHFVMFPGAVNEEPVQREMIESLKDVRVILLASEGKIVYEYSKGRSGSGILDDYIRNNYRFDRKIGKYSIYLKRHDGPR